MDILCNIWHWTTNHIALLLMAFYLALAIYIILMMVLSRLNPVKTLSWIVVLLTLPYIGIILYLFLGQNHRKRKMYSRKGMRDVAIMDSLGKQQILQIYYAEWKNAKKIEKFKNTILLQLNNSRALLTYKNKVDVYDNGPDTFAAMKKSIAEAHFSIHLESYIIEADNIGVEIKELLMRKVQEGVEVRVIYDDIGSWKLPKQYVSDLKKAGVKIYPFAKVRFPWLSRTVNYRNHRKILVVDGRIGFLGGINIADRYVGGGEFNTWRDTHLRIEGEAVHSLQAAFLLDWFFVSKKQVGQRENYYPKFDIRNKHYVQVVPSGPDSDWESIMQAYFSAITQAKEHIYIITPYFTPNDSILTAIKIASLSGVDVRLILPGKSDSKLTYWSTMSYLSELMDAGVKVYLYQKGFNHSKIITIDGSFAAIGSANMDTRSFEHNFEITALFYDEHIASQLEEHFQTDMKNSRLVRSYRWEKRSYWQKLKEGLARLLSPLL
ncbi:MAG: cardiolipin synthase [Prevotellaceae bacterium]|nr:cardiolipin synthase [Prevotellaceae bacterium]